MARYVTISQLNHNNHLYVIGSEVELADEIAKQLIAEGVVVGSEGVANRNTAPDVAPAAPAVEPAPQPAPAPEAVAAPAEVQPEADPKNTTTEVQPVAVKK